MLQITYRRQERDVAFLNPPTLLSLKLFMPLNGQGRLGTPGIREADDIVFKHVRHHQPHIPAIHARHVSSLGNSGQLEGQVSQLRQTPRPRRKAR